VLNSTFGYLDAELTAVKSTVPPGVDPGNKLPRSPEFTASLGIQKSVVIGDASSLIARVDYSWSDNYFIDLANAPGIAQDAYGLLSARLTYGPYTGRWEASLFGTNLTDEDYLASGFVATAFGPSLIIAAPPRQYGATVSLRF
jgi:iron complex outermembrane receptor protein